MVVWNRPPANIWQCHICKRRRKGAAELRRRRGCEKPTSIRNPAWEIDGCWVCGGRHPDCPVCKGSGHIPVQRCPRAEMDSRLLPFFVEYKRFGRYPDGRGRWYQPVKLLAAYEVMDYYWARCEQRNAEEQARKAEREAERNAPKTRRRT